MVLHMKGFSMLFISMGVMVSKSILSLNVKCALQNHTMTGCSEKFPGYLTSIVKQWGHFRNINSYAY